MINNKPIKIKKKKWGVAKKGDWRVLCVFDSRDKAEASISNNNLYEVREIL